MRSLCGFLLKTNLIRQEFGLIRVRDTGKQLRREGEGADAPHQEACLPPRESGNQGEKSRRHSPGGFLRS